MDSIDLPTHGLKDGQTVAFRFPPIPDSANRWYYFVADSPDAGLKGRCHLTLRNKPHEEMRAQRYEDGLPTQGSLVMKLEFNGVSI